MGLLFGTGSSIMLKMTKRKQNHSTYSSSNFSTKESYLQTTENKYGQRGTDVQDRWEYTNKCLATLNELKFGERADSHIPDYEGTETDYLELY